ncbi:hypothetical protein RB7050 [Rhodopirellula baltica SH 1]|uniref:Uncharacterized protein n=1 Tax=Rhodopirellula baltica (strain DSM 10527 / NCIMB 13988 / SH1) TaxID=243090 RepID=Q7UPB3_RHOBA|nr:hypothetical protein RB7050 [Rhodopirellula baltica SH 1]
MLAIIALDMRSKSQHFCGGRRAIKRDGYHQSTHELLHAPVPFDLPAMLCRARQPCESRLFLSVLRAVTSLELLSFRALYRSKLICYTAYKKETVKAKEVFTKQDHAKIR